MFLILCSRCCCVASADASSASCVLGYFHFRVNIIPYLLTYILLLLLYFCIIIMMQPSRTLTVTSLCRLSSRVKCWVCRRRRRCGFIISTHKTFSQPHLVFDIGSESSVVAVVARFTSFVYDVPALASQKFYYYYFLLCYCCCFNDCELVL